MAKGKMGPNSQFPYSYDKLEELFEQYKQETDSNTVQFPCVQDFFDRNKENDNKVQRKS